MTRPGRDGDLGGDLAAALPERVRDGVLAYRQVSVVFDVGRDRWVVCTRFGTVSVDTQIPVRRTATITAVPAAGRRCWPGSAAWWQRSWPGSCGRGAA